ncbi:hypothetical protein NVV94_17225 [Pseudomonas sp. LS1212]|uniref:alpha/beta fold hydrolase n=1 Tax=Pseudomonas sp. LS1212 TaxID=2972478 RepID=UPI00215D3DBA|nr:hypothetical protein [Pseudomonas sp. LS1212]UVJ42373.1 hypothetical protein NVV94_17225 [Pseudomonas sp. LS1212]
MEKRTEQALLVIKEFGLHRKELNLIGFSMVAYNALHIATKLTVARLGLAIPAVYSSEAAKLNFDESFTVCIRKHKSWIDSECFNMVKAFPGKLLVISAEQDSIIPSGIPCRLTERAERCSSAEHHCIRNADHDLAKHFNKHPEARYSTLASILRWLE